MTHPRRRTFGSPDRGVQPVSLSDQSDLAHLRADRGHEVAAAASPRSRPRGQEEGARYEQETQPPPVHRRERRGRRGGFARRRPRGVRRNRQGGRASIPPGQLGLQQFSVRDATARLSIASSNRLGVAPTMGFLGGPNYPDDPTDLGPLVPLPGGYAEVFEFLASVGVRGFEFFQSTQNANELAAAQPTAAEIRQYLDAAGLKAVGTHQFGLGNLDPATGNLTPAGETLFEFLSTLGMDTMGFSGNLSQIPNNSPDPANPS